MPVYFVIGENGEFFGSELSREAYDQLHELYTETGLSDEETHQLLVLAIKDAAYFAEGGAFNRHGGRGLAGSGGPVLGTADVRRLQKFRRCGKIMRKRAGRQ